MTSEDLLPSWRDGAARSALVEFLGRADEIPIDERVAVFDNDGTLWCEKPRYAQLDFFLWELGLAVRERPELHDVPEYDALLRGDPAALAGFGLERIAAALLGLFEGSDPQSFEHRVRSFFAAARHPETGRRYDRMVYRPMVELLEALEGRGFATCIVTGGGTEFVRAISDRVYGVPPERVVGTLVTYEFRRRNGRPVLLRTRAVQGAVNEGAAKVSNIQVGLGRRPALAAGNSPGDAEMLEYTLAGAGPRLALLVNHDDPAREHAYRSEAATFSGAESITAAAARLGWTQVSMRDDWAVVFPEDCP